MPIPSPFFEKQQAANAAWLFKNWAGYIAPVRCEVANAYEIAALRTRAGVIDVTPLFKIAVRGDDAARFLSSVTVANIGKLRVRRTRYLCWCDDDGRLIDDGTVTHLGEKTFMLTAAEPQMAWLSDLASGFDVELEDQTDTIAALAIQGPQAARVIDRFAPGSVDGLRFFGNRNVLVDGRTIRISRTGYTGDLGYEIWVDNDDASWLWDRLFTMNADRLLPCGLEALDAARLEAGFIMAGVDYESALHHVSPSRWATPDEMGLGWTVDLDDNRSFVGRQAIEKQRRRGASRSLVGLAYHWESVEKLFTRYDLAPTMSTTVCREAVPVRFGRRFVGVANSRAFSSTLKQGLALALVDSRLATLGTTLQVEMTPVAERHWVEATVVKRPFFSTPRMRQKIRIVDG